MEDSRIDSYKPKYFNSLYDIHDLEENINRDLHNEKLNNPENLDNVRQKVIELKGNIKKKLGKDNPDYKMCSDVYRAVFGQPKNSKIVAFFAGRLEHAGEKKPPLARAILVYRFMRAINGENQALSVNTMFGGKRRTMRRKRLSRRSKSLKRRRPL